MYIRDPVQGHLVFPEELKKILDTPQIQRLRFIRQMGTAFLVYPGANHTRFEHSLGCAHLSFRLAKALGEEPEVFLLAGLVHDVGHPPFSHDLEPVLGDHEARFMEAIEGRLKDLLLERLSLKEVKKLPNLPEISGSLGSDRLDYLVRDAHYTGVAYGVIDVPRLLERIGKEREVLFVDEGGLLAAESLLIARFQMYEAVYLHKTVRIAAAMLREAVREVGVLEWKLTDYEVLERIKYTSMGQRLLQRRLLKALPVDHSRENQEIARELGLLYDPPYQFVRDERVFVSIGGEMKEITEISPLAAALRKRARPKGLFIGEEKVLEVLRKKFLEKD